jgi:hypothetical protein
MYDTDPSYNRLTVVGKVETFDLIINPTVADEVRDKVVVDLMMRGPRYFLKEKRGGKLPEGVILVRK